MGDYFQKGLMLKGAVIPIEFHEEGDLPVEKKSVQKRFSLPDDQTERFQLTH